MRDFGAETPRRDRHGAANSAVPTTSFAEADYAPAYTADLFDRLTGYPALERLKQKPSRLALEEIDDATAYADDLFERLRGLPARQPLGHDFRFLHARDPGHRERTWGALAEAEYATAYVNDTFERLRGFPARQSLSHTARFVHADRHRPLGLSRSRRRAQAEKKPWRYFATTARSLLYGGRNTSNATERIYAGAALPSRRAARPPSAVKGSGRSEAQWADAGLETLKRG